MYILLAGAHMRVAALLDMGMGNIFFQKYVYGHEQYFFYVCIGMAMANIYPTYS
jgi:hypothetical protein